LQTCLVCKNITTDNDCRLLKHSINQTTKHFVADEQVQQWTLYADAQNLHSWDPLPWSWFILHPQCIRPHTASLQLLLPCHPSLCLPSSPWSLAKSFHRPFTKLLWYHISTNTWYMAQPMKSHGSQYALQLQLPIIFLTSSLVIYSTQDTHTLRTHHFVMWCFHVLD